MKPLIFFGSGVSRPSGLPDVVRLTEAIFADRWAKHGDSNFYPKRAGDPPCAETKRCQEFLRRLLARVEPYYLERRGTAPNYEDLFFLVEQIQYDELAWDDNAALQSFRQETKRLSTDLSRSPNGIDSKFWFQNLTAIPHFLTGSYNKIAQYGAGIFLSQMQEFDRALATHSVIVMSGYGWGDKGINMRLKNWLWEKRGRRILLLYEDLESLRSSKALFFQFEDLLGKEMLIPTGKWFCDSQVTDLMPYL